MGLPEVVNGVRVICAVRCAVGSVMVRDCVKPKLPRT